MIPAYYKIFIILSVALTLQSVHAEEIRLIVRGDDLGITQGSNAGFEKAFKEGVLTSASIQVPAPCFETGIDDFTARFARDTERHQGRILIINY